MDISNPSFTQRLDDEIKSCSLPDHDPRTASSDELIRDLHRVVTGNGEFNRGLIFKMASANTNLAVMRDTVTDLTGKLGDQIKRCDDIQKARAIEAAERTTAGKVTQAIWKNKALLFLIFLFALACFGTLITRYGLADTDEKIIKTIDNRIEKLLVGVVPPAAQIKKTP